MSKQEMRKQLAALTFSEKVKILEKLRDRSLAFAAARLKRKSTNESGAVGAEKPEGDGGCHE
jgi:hypothetical protein